MYDTIKKETKDASVSFFAPGYGLLSLIPKRWQHSNDIIKRLVKVVETLAMGLPVISSDGPFNDDILDEHNSIRVNSDDVDARTDAIRKLLDDKALRKSMADYSNSRHVEYSIEGRAKRILGFINEQIRK